MTDTEETLFNAAQGYNERAARLERDAANYRAQADTWAQQAAALREQARAIAVELGLAC